MNYAKLFQEIFANVCYIYVTIQPNSLFFFPRMMCEMYDVLFFFTVYAILILLFSWLKHKSSNSVF